MEPKVIVILPAYNEEESINRLFEGFSRIVPHLGDYEIILVNDGSTDRTVQQAEAWREKLNLVIVHHEKNKGLGPAIKTGLYHAIGHSVTGSDPIVYMDADCTHPPSYVPELVAQVKDGADMVIASRFLPGSKEVGVPLMRRLYSRGARFLFHLLLPLPGVTDFTCGFRAYRSGLIKNALERFGDAIIERTGFACTDDLLVNLATFDISIAEIPFTLRYDRKRGQSKLKLLLTIKETLRMLLKARKKLLAPKQPLN